MFAIVITGPDDFRDRRTFAQDLVTIGRASINDLVLDHPSVAPIHAMLYADLRGFALEAAEAAFANGVAIRRGDQAALGIGQRIGIGELVLVIEAVPVESSATPLEVERGLISAIELERDVASREVYADWLEEHGQEARAEFVRLELCMLGTDHGFRRDQMQVRLRELASTIDPQWRVRVACPQVSCGRCSQHWGNLEPTANPAIRHCSTCAKDAHYCLSSTDAETHRRAGHVVVMDLLPDANVERDSRGRLVRCPVCGLDMRNVNAHPLNPVCPRCGTRVR